MMPMIFSIINLVCGILIVVIAFDNNFCSWFRIFFGVCIAWVAITTQICDQWALVWFPLWNKSFGFMGSTYIFLACGGYYWLYYGSDSWIGFAYFVVWAVGIAYCVIWLCMILNCCGCPLPVPLLESCGSGGGGGGGNANNNNNKNDGGQTTSN